jgi:signal transduction histidine kinase
MAEITLASAPGTSVLASRVWEMLTSPHPRIVGSERRRRAHIASAVLFALVFCLGIFMLISFGLPALVPWLMVVAAYGVSRTQYFEQAVLLACAAYILAVFWAMLGVPDWTTVSALGYLAWLIVPILLSGLLLTPKATLLLAIVMSTIMLLMRPLFLPTLPAASFGVAGGFVIMMSALITLATYLQQFYFVRPQLREIQDAKGEVERNNAALEKAYRDMREFSYIIAHDLRSPVVSTREFVREARYAFDALMPAVDPAKVATQERPAVDAAMSIDLPEALDYIDTAAQRMERLIAEILRIARVGQYEVNHKQIDISLLVEKLLAGVRQAHPKASIATRNLPQEVVTDPFVIEQSLGNLIDNAVKYVSPSRPLEISISGEVKNGELVLEVKDNGRGIAPAEQKVILQPFRRASNAQDIAGNGIGLYYVQSLLARLGGRIEFTSELDVGSRFSVALPVGERKA